MALLDFISGIFSPVATIIDDLNTSDEERLQLRNELAKIEGQALGKLTEVEMARLDAVSKIQVAEAGSSNWLTSGWRPASSVLFVIIIVASSFGLIPQPGQEFYDLAQTFLGIYGSSRGIEKAVKIFKSGK